MHYFLPDALKVRNVEVANEEKSKKQYIIYKNERKFKEMWNRN